jgi:hypothetical protein
MKTLTLKQRLRRAKRLKKEFRESVMKFADAYATAVALEKGLTREIQIHNTLGGKLVKRILPNDDDDEEMPHTPLQEQRDGSQLRMWFDDDERRKEEHQ